MCAKTLVKEYDCGPSGAEDCDGCRSGRIIDWIRGCHFRKCAEEKGLEFFCFCSQGKEKWLEARRKEWTCKNCGAGTHWYQKKCVCGAELDAWEVPK